jgi:hypothetical protein
LAFGSIFRDFDAKRAWLREHRSIVDPEPEPRINRAKPTMHPPRKLTGWKLKLALKNQPSHIREELLVQ